jgi:hypothetical protein
MIQRGKGLALEKQTRRLGAPGGVHKKRVMEIVDPRLVVNLPPRAVHKAAMLTYHCLRCTDGQHVFKNYHKKSSDTQSH